MNKSNNNISDSIVIKSKSRQELANEYGISSRTFRRWLKNNDITLPSGLVKPRDILKVYDKLGNPTDILR